MTSVLRKERYMALLHEMKENKLLLLPAQSFLLVGLQIFDRRLCIGNHCPSILSVKV